MPSSSPLHQYTDLLRNAFSIAESAHDLSTLKLLNGISQNPSNTASGVLLTKLNSGLAEIRRIAALGLGKIGANDFRTLPALERFYESFGATDMHDATAATKAIAMLRTKDAASALQRIIEKSATAPHDDPRFAIALAAIPEAGAVMLTQIDALLATPRKFPQNSQTHMPLLQAAYEGLLQQGRQLYAEFVAKGREHGIQELGMPLQYRVREPKTFRNKRRASIEVCFDDQVALGAFSASQGERDVTRMVVLSNSKTLECLVLMVHGVTSTPDFEKLTRSFPELAAKSLKSFGLLPKCLNFGCILPASPQAPLGSVLQMNSTTSDDAGSLIPAPEMLSKLAGSFTDEVLAHLSQIGLPDRLSDYLHESIESQHRLRVGKLNQLPRMPTRRTKASSAGQNKGAAVQSPRLPEAPSESEAAAYKKLADVFKLLTDAGSEARSAKTSLTSTSSLNRYPLISREPIPHDVLRPYTAPGALRFASQHRHAEFDLDVTQVGVFMLRARSSLGEINTITNVPLSAYYGAQGFAWGGSSDSPEAVALALNVLNCFLPPDEQLGDNRIQMQGCPWLNNRPSFASKQAIAMAPLFAKEVLSQVPLHGGHISVDDITQWIDRNKQVH